MDFGKVFSRSWQIIWNNKVLWLFGILASCGSRSGSGGGGGNFSSSFQTQNNPNLPPQMQDWARAMERFFERTPEDQLILYGLIAIFAVLLIALIFWLIGMYGKSALITGVLQADGGRKLSFGQLWRDGWAPYGRILGLNTILGLLVFLAVAAVAVFFILVGAATAGIGLICLVPLLCVFIPLGFAFGVYGELANVAVVKEGLGATAALDRAWNLLRSNLGSLALMSIILIVGGIVVSIALAIPLFIVLAPLFAAMLSGSEQAMQQSFGLMLVGFLIYLPIAIVANGIIQSYLQSAWTLAYGEVAGGSKAALPAAPKPAAPRKTATRKTSTRKS